MKCYWEPWETHWEQQNIMGNSGNIIGDIWKQHRNKQIKKFHSHPLPPPTQRKEMNLLRSMLCHVISYMHISFLNTIASIFLPKLIPLLQSAPYLLHLYFTLRLVSSLNYPKNSEVNFCEC